MTRSRRVHESTGRQTCACGAKFKTPGKLRAHVALYQPDEQAVGFGPRTPDIHQKKKKRTAV